MAAAAPKAEQVPVVGDQDVTVPASELVEILKNVGVPGAKIGRVLEALPTPDADEDAALVIQGRKFYFDDFSLDEAEEIETRCDNMAWSDVLFEVGRLRVGYLKILAHVVLRRENVELTVEDVGKLNFREILSGNGNGAGPEGDARPPDEAESSASASG